MSDFTRRCIFAHINVNFCNGESKFPFLTDSILLMCIGIPVGRMQAYGWSLPSRYSTEGANDSKGLLSVPVPIYCRPLNVNEPGMKVKFQPKS